MNDFTECDQFQNGSRKWQICRGEAGIPLSKCNKYRSHWGLSEIFNEGTSEKFRDDVVFVSHGVSKDQGDSRYIYGAGTELIKAIDLLGAEKCEDCIALAMSMDNWGIAGCRNRIEDIVDDIMPRAVLFAHAKHPWLKWVPSRIKDLMVRKSVVKMVVRAINTAEKVILTGERLKSRPVAFRVNRSQSKGCGCGKKRRVAKRNPRPSVSENVSNLILDTTWGAAGGVDNMQTKVRTIPFQGTPTRNLLYHVYPLGDKWKWNIDQILARIDIFNGRRIVAIAVDETTASADDVRKYFGGAVHEYMVYENNRNRGEMVSFIPLLAQLQSTDTNQITFRAHAKGVAQKTKKAPHIMDWTEMLYATNLDDLSLVEDQLTEFAMTGACRKWDQFKKSQRLPTYSGTFYWFRNCYVYSRKWRDVPMMRWGCEAWPGRMFSPSETACTFWDNTGSMYSTEYWESQIKPAYEEWKRAHSNHANR